MSVVLPVVSLRHDWYKGVAPPVVSGSTPLTTNRDRTSIVAKKNLDAPACVYKVTCLLTGKAYIGVTIKTLEWRWGQHRKEARGSRFDTVLYRAMRLYGPDAFSVELLCEAPTALEAQRIERELIARYRTLAPNGMNTSSGGENWAGIARTDEVRAKISAAKKGKSIWSAEARQAMSEARRGKKVSEAQIAGLRAAHADPEFQNRQRERMKARWENPEFRAIALANIAKTNESRKGVARTPEEKAAISAGRIGKSVPWTEERKLRNKSRFEDPAYRARMGEMSKCYWDANPQERERRRAVVSEMNKRYGRMVQSNGGEKERNDNNTSCTSKKDVV